MVSDCVSVLISFCTFVAAFYLFMLAVAPGIGLLAFLFSVLAVLFVPLLRRNERRSSEAFVISRIFPVFAGVWAFFGFIFSFLLIRSFAVGLAFSASFPFYEYDKVGFIIFLFCTVLLGFLGNPAYLLYRSLSSRLKKWVPGPVWVIVGFYFLSITVFMFITGFGYWWLQKNNPFPVPKEIAVRVTWNEITNKRLDGFTQKILFTEKIDCFPRKKRDSYLRRPLGGFPPCYGGTWLESYDGTIIDSVSALTDYFAPIESELEAMSLVIVTNPTNTSFMYRNHLDYGSHDIPFGHTATVDGGFLIHLVESRGGGCPSYPGFPILRNLIFKVSYTGEITELPAGTNAWLTRPLEARHFYYTCGQP